jgi:hypothetical protein
MRETCPTPDSNCPLKKCFGDTHHLYYPASWYKGIVELAFRNLPENKEFLCRREHNERHATEEPPEKPSREFMLNAIQRAKEARYGN